MSGLSELSQALTGFSAASAALELSDIKKLLEEQNALLWQQHDSDRSDIGHHPSGIEVEDESYSQLASQEQKEAVAKLLLSYQLANFATVINMFPDIVAQIGRDQMPFFAEQCREAICSSEWKYQLSEKKKFIIYALTSKIPSEAVQRLFAVLFLSRDAYRWGYKYEYNDFWDGQYSGSDTASKPIPIAELNGPPNINVDYSLTIHGQVFTLKLSRKEINALYLIFSILHPFIKVSPGPEVAILRDRKYQLTKGKLHSLIGPSPAEFILEEVIKRMAGMPYAKFIAAKEIFASLKDSNVSTLLRNREPSSQESYVPADVIYRKPKNPTAASRTQVNIKKGSGDFRSPSKLLASLVLAVLSMFSVFVFTQLPAATALMLIGAVVCLTIGIILLASLR